VFIYRFSDFLLSRIRITPTCLPVAQNYVDVVSIFEQAFEAKSVYGTPLDEAQVLQSIRKVRSCSKDLMLSVCSCYRSAFVESLLNHIIDHHGIQDLRSGVTIEFLAKLADKAVNWFGRWGKINRGAVFRHSPFESVTNIVS